MLDRYFLDTAGLHFQNTLALHFHPPVQEILLEPPPIPQLESHAGYPVFVQVLVEGVRGDPQVL